MFSIDLGAILKLQQIVFNLAVYGTKRSKYLL